MSNITFTDEQIALLLKNKYVKNVSSKGITYTMEFKHLAVEDYISGLSAREVFEKYGFNISMIGIKRPNSALARWKSNYRKDGILGLKDTREINSGRPLKRKLSDKEKIERYEIKMRYMEAEIEFLKKVDAKERLVIKRNKSKTYIYELITLIKNKYNLKNKIDYLCQIANVSRSGYYSHLKIKHEGSIKEIRDLELLTIVRQSMNYKGYKKGSRQIAMRINRIYKEQGLDRMINRKCVQRIMRKFDISCPIRKPNPYRRMMKATKEHRTLKNIVNRQFKSGEVGKILLTDITYLHYKGHKEVAYLSTIKDAQTNEIISYELSKSLSLDIAINTINKISNNKYLSKKPIIHSDQGFHYTSPRFQNVVKGLNIEQSMSRRGNCWDNAPQESYFGHMKQEIKSVINYEEVNEFNELSTIISKYINYYNNERPQWNLKKLTPVEYRNQLILNI